MDEKILERIYAKHTGEGCFMPWDEWAHLVENAYDELINIAKTVPYSRITITYSELGKKIGLFPLSEWFHLKIAWVLYACATYAQEFSLPMITALVVNSETGQPGKGFWGLDGIPDHMKKFSTIDDLSPFDISGGRDKFWVEQLELIDRWGKS